MDLFRSMRAFVTVAQAGSMSAAAHQLGLSPAMVGQHVAALEEHLGTRLLHRTTRRQSLTDFGANYIEQCRDILERVALAELEAETLRSTPRGQLRITAPVSFGAEVLVPALGKYCERAPEVTLDITLTDRAVDLVEEGFDLAFRVGTPPDSRLVARRLRAYRMIVCAAPDYLERTGWPEHPSDLARFTMIAFTPAARAPWKFSRNGETVEVTPPRRITVNSGQALRTAALAGLGLIQQPKLLLASDLREGRLVPVLEDWQLGERPLSLVYYRDRHMTPRLRGFISFAVAEFATAE